jgi:phosphate:Na+ symporter
MNYLQVTMAGLTAVILFIFGLEHFSREIEKISGEKFRKFLGKATRLPLVGVIIGALVTAVIQSSSATSVITIGLVNAGVLSFKNSIGVIFGSNVGTTVTAQLVAFKLTAFAPLLIIAGFFLSLTRHRYAIFGKSIFYFGFVFFSLNLISAALAPLEHEPAFVRYLTEPQSPLLAILVGCLFTAVLQSSSVTTGLAIIFTQQGLLGLENAVPIIMGANIGTTATALIAVFNMDVAAKKTALAHFMFNVGGVIVFTPFLFLFGDRLGTLTMEPEMALAAIHLVFNVATTVIFLLLIGPFTRLIDRLLGEGKMDFERLPIPAFDERGGFERERDFLREQREALLGFLQENYNLVTLSIETNYRNMFEASAKRLEYLNYVEKEYLAYFSRLVSIVRDEQETGELMRLINQYDYLFQVHDSIEDLFTTRKVMSEGFIELKSDILLLVRELSSDTLALFEDIRRALAGKPDVDLWSTSRALQSQLDRANRELLSLAGDPQRRDAGALTNFVTYSRRLKDKLVNFAALEAADSRQLMEAPLAATAAPEHSA